MGKINIDEYKDGRSLFVYACIILLMCIVFGVGIVYNSIKTAVIERNDWIDYSKGLAKQDRTIPPTRGQIFSDEGFLMAASIPSYYTYIDFKAGGFKQDTFLRSKTDNVTLLSKGLAKLFKGRSYLQYKQHLERGFSIKSRHYPLLSHKINYSQLKDLKELPFLRLGTNVGGLHYTEQIFREHPYGSLAERTIGQVYGEQKKGGLSAGINGIELTYDSLLRGTPGRSGVERIGGRWTNVTELEPINGMDVHTTINVDMQDITEKALLKMLKQTDAETGTAVVMEVSTGAVKSISNLTRISDGKYREQMNQAVGFLTEPGSTFKVAAMMVALEDGVCKATDSVNTERGVFRYKGARMTDHNANKGGYGWLSAEKAIWNSSNIGVAKFIIAGYESHPEKFIEGLKRTGIADDLHLELVGSGKTILRTPSDKQWSKTSLAWMSFGYEVLMPPIYTLAFFNAIANNGEMMRPYFTEKITEDGSVFKEFPPQTVRSSICSEKTLATIQSMLRGVVEKGTGAGAFSDVVSIAGKTGTAQIVSGGSYTKFGRAHQVSFAGYFPADKPKYSCICVIRKPRIGYPSGGVMAGGVVKTIAEQIYADQTFIDIEEEEVDSLAVLTPKVKKGGEDKAEMVLDEMDISVDDELLNKTHVAVHEGLVPNTIGMGASDALYLLENMGLKVSLNGSGTVVYQSLPIGSKVVRGRYISLRLR